GGDETITTVNDLGTAADSGGYTSIAIGADGLPIVSYYDITNENLNIAKCNTAPCTAANQWSTTTPDSTGTVGIYTSIAIGTDGLPIVSYYDGGSNGNLNIAKCNTEPCTTATNWSTTTPDSISTVGLHTSIAIGIDGLPIVSYYDNSNGNLNIAKCNTAPCTAANQWSTTTPDSTGTVGLYTSMAIGRDGFPIISYQDVTNAAMKIAKCNDMACSGGDETITTVNDLGTAADSGGYTSIAIGKDGYPWVSYFDNDNNDLKVAKQLGLPTMAIGYFNRTTKTDGQAKVTRTRWTKTSTSSNSMIIEQSPMIEDGLAYWFDKAGYAAVTADDTATTTITSSGNSSATTTPLFYFAEKHTSSTLPLYARWIGQSTVAAGTKNIKLEVFKFGATSSDTKWYTLDTDSSCNANSDCDLQGSTTTDLSYFYFPEYNFDESRGSVLGTSTYPTYGTTTLAEFWTFWRVYQDPAIGGQDLKSDYWKVQSTGDTDVSTFGTQNSPMYIPSNNNYVGGGFAVPSNYGSRNVTGIIITENGTVNAQTGLGNVALYYGFDTSAPYDCSGESLGGTQFGATTTFNGADGTASFTGSAAISTTQTLCVYTLLNVASGASDGQTLEIKINNPLSDVTVSSGGVSPITAVEIPGTTNLTVLPSTITQRAFIFQNDDGSEVNGNSNSGSANTTSTPVKKGERLIARFQIDETGGVATTTSFKLQYNTGWVGDWVDVMGSGPPSTNKYASTSDWNATTVDSTGSVGDSYTSIAISADGLPIVSYRDTTNLNLNIAKCTAEPCTTQSNWTTTSPDGYQGGSVGTFTSIAIGADGLPIVSYYDNTNLNLNIAKCNTSPCTQANQWSTTSPDSTGSVGTFTSIAIGADGLPIVSYLDYTGSTGNLNIAKCTAEPCTTQTNWSTTSV
ncbi:MAG: hypothetical protein Q7J73_01610, partial [Dehalococcoidales bacterium]|nr:hypothetical protein [Dehalococcoidales bacterium]